jgi:surface antigen
VEEWGVNFQARCISVRLENIKFKYLAVVIVLLASFITPLIKVTNAYASNDDYPSQWKNAAMDSMFDSWGEYNRECTSFVAWRLSSKNGYSMPFHDNAMNWAADAKTRGIMVDSSPALGSVAYKGNHVAWVESVSTDKTKVTLEEYNEVDSNSNGVYGDDGTYSERTVAANMYQYIHFKDIQSNVTNSPTPGINAAFLGKNSLYANEIIWSGQYILSENALYLLVMQGDGNLVLYGNGMQAVWASGTAGSGANHIVMQSDGNLVIYTPNNRAVWASGTAGRGQSGLYIQDDGNLVVYTNSLVPTWNSKTGGHSTLNFLGADRLSTNQIMQIGQYIKSEDGKYVLLLQGDGNLVLYGPAYHVLWNSNTSSQGVAFAAMQGDGNLVLYTSNNQPMWSSATAGRGSSYSVVQSDGNFVIYTIAGLATWNTGTAGRI